MAQSLVYTVEKPWLPHANCPSDIAPILEKAVQAFPPHFLLEPAKGEVFQSAQDCLKRLQGFALSAGFAVVVRSASLKGSAPRFRYCCIHHGLEIRNTRNLEENVVYNSENEVISRR